ncbi:MAG: hypothetical protein DRJ68_04080 [Thermoprotei archaeon]|nr:MAG: hypothetical protein DRJ68_04080 [Thermoprotei archaeon]
MARIVLGYPAGGRTPQDLVAQVYHGLLSQGVNVQYTSPTSIRIKKGALVFWEGTADLRAYQNGPYVELEISSSEKKSFLLGGLVGMSRAKAAREGMIRTITSILGQPAYMR